MPQRDASVCGRVGPGLIARRDLRHQAGASVVVAAIVVAIWPSAASAHIFAGDGGPGAGFIHPLTGPDHLLAMFTVGLLSARLGGRAIWTVPAAFLCGMTVGGALGLAGLPLPADEPGIALSIFILGGLLLWPLPRLAWLALMAAGLFGVVHGYAHGREMPRVASPGLYVAGFIAATAGLHLMGALTALLVLCRPGGERRLQRSGIVIAGAGLLFLARTAVPSWTPLRSDPEFRHQTVSSLGSAAEPKARAIRRGLTVRALSVGFGDTAR